MPLLCVFGRHRRHPLGSSDPGVAEARECRRCGRQQAFLAPLGRWVEGCFTRRGASRPTGSRGALRLHR